MGMVALVVLVVFAVAVMEHQAALACFVPAAVLAGGSCCLVMCALIELPLHVLQLLVLQQGQHGSGSSVC